MKKPIAFMAACLLALAAFCACGKTETIYVYNWADYIGEDVIKDFTKETGINVKYDTFETNEAMYAKVKNGGAAYDVIIPSDYMIERMVNEGLVQPLDFSKIPQYAHIDRRFVGLPYDAGEKYSVSYMWGTVGLLYNTDMVDNPVDSWDILWDSTYAGKIFMYESERDTLGLALKRLGYSLNTRSQSELDEAVKALIEQKPLTKAYMGDPIKDKMIGGEGALAVTYSGDAQYCQGLNDKLDFAVPNEGSNIFADGMVVPSNAKNYEAALAFIDFMCRPEIAARNSEYIGYATTNKDALPLMDPDFVNNPIFAPDDAVLERCEFFSDLGDFKRAYSDAFSQILMSGNK